VTLVQVVGMDLKAEGSQDADAADAEDDFLFEPVCVVAAVQVIGQPPVFLGVLIQLRIQE
jgi:hypothetical protein